MLFLFLLCPFLDAQEKYYKHTQQFSQEFLNNLEQQQEHTPSTFTMLDAMYLHNQTNNQQEKPIAQSNKWPKLKITGICLLCMWSVFKIHQGMSAVIGEKFSTAVVQNVFNSIYTSGCWLLKKISTELYSMLHTFIRIFVMGT